MNRRTGAAAAATLIATVAFVALPTPAFAVPQLVTVTQTFSPPNPAFDAKTVACPAPTATLGAGVAVLGDATVKDHMHVHVLAPVDNGAFGHVQNHDIPDFDYVSPAAMRVTAICGVASGWEAVEAATLMVGPDDFIKTVTVTCPGNKKVIGAGGSAGKNWFLRPIAIDPSNDLTSVTVKVGRSANGDYVQEIKAYAICVNPLRFHVLATATSQTSTLDKTVTVTCPGTSKVHGVGGGIVGSGGLAHITRLEPLNASTAVLEASGPSSGLVQGWSAHVHAICAV